MGLVAVREAGRLDALRQRRLTARRERGVRPRAWVATLEAAWCGWQCVREGSLPLAGPGVGEAVVL